MINTIYYLIAALIVFSISEFVIRYDRKITARLKAVWSPIVAALYDFFKLLGKSTSAVS